MARHGEKAATRQTWTGVCACTLWTFYTILLFLSQMLELRGRDEGLTHMNTAFGRLHLNRLVPLKIDSAWNSASYMVCTCLQLFSMLFFSKMVLFRYTTMVWRMGCALKGDSTTKYTLKYCISFKFCGLNNLQISKERHSRNILLQLNFRKCWMWLKNWVLLENSRLQSNL